MFHYTPPQNLLQDRVILITGANRGIGAEAARTFARYQARLILVGRNQGELEALANELAPLGADPLVARLDLERASEAEYRALAQQINERYQRLDGVLFNAGILGQLQRIEALDVADWDRVMQVNLRANLLLTQALLPLVEQTAARYGDASLLYTSSTVGRRGRAGWGSYAISKFAIEGLMEVLADELQPLSIRVNSINPGATRTAMRRQARPEENPLSVKEPASLMPLYLYLMGSEHHGETGQRFEPQGLRSD